MTDNSAYKDYLRDVVYMIREEAARAKREKEETGSDFHDGRELALRQVLASMQNRAEAFLIAKDSILLDGFDPFKDNPDPA